MMLKNSKSDYKITFLDIKRKKYPLLFYHTKYTFSKMTHNETNFFNIKNT